MEFIFVKIKNICLVTFTHYISAQLDVILICVTQTGGKLIAAKR